MKMVRRLPFALLILVIVIYSVFPIYWMVVSSVRTQASLYQPSLLPGPFGWYSYQTLFTLTNFPRYLLNSIIVSVGSTALTLAIATPMAYALIRGRVRGAKFMVRCMLFAYMFPALLLLIPMDIFFVRTGLDNSLLSLILAFQSFTLPLAVWLLWSYFKTFPFAIEEAALVDGCTRWQVIYRIILPVSRPGMLTVAILSFLLAWSDFVFPMILTSSDDMRTIPYGLTQIGDMYASDWGVLMAGATLAAFPLVVLFMLLGRHFIHGLSAGAVK